MIWIVKSSSHTMNLADVGDKPCEAFLPEILGLIAQN